MAVNVEDAADPQWVPQGVAAGRVRYRREVSGLDRIMAYVEFERWEDSPPTSCHWSVQDGSCGKVLDQGWVDAEQGGLGGAFVAADAAVARLFPGH